MNPLIPSLVSGGEVLAQVNGCLGLITLNRPAALNALSLPMVRDITTLLQHWAAEPAIEAVVILGQNREGKAPAFCAGGDIRFFYQAARAGDPALHDFFTEEYALNHLIHTYAKPYIALMDGIVMGGGMGISQGARLRVVNERSKLAMPETHIGLFPDVGGGWFLAQCPGHTGEWLALTGQTLGAADAIELGLADLYIDSSAWDGLIHALRAEPQPNAEHVVATVMERVELAPPTLHHAHRADIDRHFGQPSLAAIVASLQADADKPWVQACLKQMAGNSPLMMAASLELVRRGRQLGLADELRLELDLVWRCFEGVTAGAHSETVEGIRALAIDKDHQPKWQPSAVADVDAAQVSRLLSSPWSAQAHPLAQLGADAA